MSGSTESRAGLFYFNIFINDTGRRASRSNEIHLALNQGVWMVQGRAGVRKRGAQGAAAARFMSKELPGEIYVRQGQPIDLGNLAGEGAWSGGKPIKKPTPSALPGL